MGRGSRRMTSLEKKLAYEIDKACLESELEEDPDLLLWMEDG